MGTIRAMTRRTTLFLAHQPAVAGPTQAGLTRRTLLAGGSLGLMAFGLAGCAGGGPVYYTLAVVPGAVMPLPPGAPTIVEIRQPGIAGGLNRDRIVTADDGYRLSISSTGAWSDSLAEQLGRVLAGDLAQRLPNAGVFVENDAVSTTPQALVELSVTRFSTNPQGFVALDGTVLVRRAGPSAAAPVIQRVTLQGARAGNTLDMVRELSTLVGRLADLVARSLCALPPLPDPAQG